MQNLHLRLIIIRFLLHVASALLVWSLLLQGIQKPPLGVVLGLVEVPCVPNQDWPQ